MHQEPTDGTVGSETVDLLAKRPQTGSTAARRIEDVRKIAVVRANGIGDFIFALPALSALRACYPDAEVVLLGIQWHVDYLRERPLPLNRVIAIPPAAGVGAPEDHRDDERALDEFFAVMKEERFDLALQMHGGGSNSNPFTSRLGARVTAGLRSEWAPPLDRWVRYVYYQPEVFRYLEVVALVGAAPVGVEPRLEAMPGDVAEARSALLHVAHPLVVVHPAVGDERRRWPAERFAAVADALAADGAQIVLTGAAPDRTSVNDVLAAMRRPALDLCGRFTLQGLTGLLSLADLVIANDTGPLHLAMALDIPAVGVYWCGNLVNGGPVSRARARPQISWVITCPVCGVDASGGSSGRQAGCDHRVSFVEGVSIGDVLEAARDLLSGALPPIRL